jgi:hypothetical protein
MQLPEIASANERWIDARPFFCAGVVAACKNQDGTIDPSLRFG